MKAIGLVPGTKIVNLLEKPEPYIKDADEVKLRVLEVGICGTDREEVSGGRSEAPAGEKELIIGHEMMGQVVEVGKAVKSVKPGDLAIFTVRRGCGECASCDADMPDMCYSGKYKERGIKALHGFQSQFVVDKEKYVIKLSDCMKSYGVLSEPMSIVQKGIDQLYLVQNARLPDWKDPNNFQGKRAIVAGLGPVGLLTAIALRLRGAEVLGFDIVEENTSRPKVLQEMGGIYVYGKKVASKEISAKYGRVDMIVEAAGIPSLDFELLEDLGTNGVYVFLGVARGNLPISVDGGTLMKNLVLNNQVLVGSVNAGRKHWEKGIEDLEKAGKKWPGVLEKIITRRVLFDHFDEVLIKHTPDEIKSVVSWAS
ncbi:MAG TPA: glucose 1-dehydrogenase [Rhabdochlamydiaceae bacterium]|nr:glucose 1-dehydrogenase [Rhabdochlamydiaceae bacterium]